MRIGDAEILEGHVLEALRQMPDNSVQHVCCSPPYWAQRNYGTEPQVWGGSKECEHEWNSNRYYTENSASAKTSEAFHEPGEENADRLKKARWREDNTCSKCGAWLGELGLEPTPQMYLANLVEVFEEVRRVLKPDGTLLLNMGNKYIGGNGNHYPGDAWPTDWALQNGRAKSHPGTAKPRNPGLKEKDMFLAAEIAIALRNAGWYLRSEIVWCLSGGTWLYVRSKKGDMPMMVKDLARLDPSTVKLWNGQQWTQLLGMSKSCRTSTELEIVLRSGERIACSETHKFPTSNGLKSASELRCGDCLVSTRLPEPETVKDCAIDDDAAWFAGLYLAEGSRNKDCITLSGHTSEEERWLNVQRIAAKFGGSANLSCEGNRQTISVYGRFLHAIIDELITGRVAQDKGIAPVVWRYSNRFLSCMLEGYLHGDGHWDDKNKRWRIGFARNYNLERDLRVICARLGYQITLNFSTAVCEGKKFPTFRGELRKTSSYHWNCKDRNEIVDIRKSRCRFVYDIGVEDEPHTYALASGVLTHNSKLSCMPESAKDRPTLAHEMLYLLTKSKTYYINMDAVAEPCSALNHARVAQNVAAQTGSPKPGKTNGNMKAVVRQPQKNDNHIDRRKVGFNDRYDATEKLAQEAVNPSLDIHETKRDLAPTEARHAASARMGREPGWRKRESGQADCLELSSDVQPKAHLPGANSRVNRNHVPGNSQPQQRVGVNPKALASDPGTKQNASFSAAVVGLVTTRNCRTVKTFKSEPSKEDHYAAFPSAIPRWSILMCTRPGDTVLDIFAGTGTTLVAAVELGRKAAGIELQPKYAKIMAKRLRGAKPPLPMFTEEQVSA